MTTAEQLDPPYPGDETEAEYQARTRNALHAIMPAELTEILSELANDLEPIAYTSVVHPMIQGKKPGEQDRDYLSRRFIEIIEPRLEAYVEQKLSEGE